MVVNRDSQNLLGLLLTDYIFIKEVPDLNGLKKIDLLVLGLGRLILKLFLNDIRTYVYALIADINTCRSCDKLFYLILCLVTKRAPDLSGIFFFFFSLIISCHPSLLDDSQRSDQ